MWTFDCPSQAIRTPILALRQVVGTGRGPRPERNTLLGEPMDAAVLTVADVTTAWAAPTPQAARRPKAVP
jgi:hypothetical protein